MPKGYPLDPESARAKRSAASKGKTYEERYGTKVAKRLRKQRKIVAKRIQLGTFLKGKTYEEIYGVRALAQATLRSDKSDAGRRKYYDRIRGKSYEEIYGEKRGQELRKLRSLNSGQNSPLWRGGIESQYDLGNEWNCIRAFILKRDNYHCQDCGNKPKLLDIHHIIPRRISRNHDLENLIVLCRKCHVKWDSDWHRLAI